MENSLKYLNNDSSNSKTDNISFYNYHNYYELYLIFIKNKMSVEKISSICGIPKNYINLIFTLAELDEYILLQSVEDGIFTAEMALEIAELNAEDCIDRLESYYLNSRLDSQHYIAIQYVLDKRRLSNFQLNSAGYEYRRERNLNTHINAYYAGLTAKHSLIADNHNIKLRLANFCQSIDTLEKDPDFIALNNDCNFPPPPLSGSKYYDDEV